MDQEFHIGCHIVVAADIHFYECFIVHGLDAGNLAADRRLGHKRGDGGLFWLPLGWYLSQFSFEVSVLLLEVGEILLNTTNLSCQCLELAFKFVVTVGELDVPRLLVDQLLSSLFQLCLKFFGDLCVLLVGGCQATPIGIKLTELCSFAERLGFTFGQFLSQ